MNVFLKLITKYTARKFTVSLIPWIYIALVWQSTGTPPDKWIVIAATIATAIFTLVEGNLDKITRAAGKIVLIALIILGLSAPGAVFADEPANDRHRMSTPVENVAPAASQDVLPPVLVVQDVATPESSATEDYCSTLVECQRSLVAATNDPPDIPMGGLLSSFPWYRNLPPWAKVTISGVTSAAILGLTVYVGSQNPQ